MRLALFAMIAVALLATACAMTPRPETGPTYRLDVLDVRGADLYARTVDFGLSADDCAEAQKRYALSTCAAEEKAENVENSA